MLQSMKNLLGHVVHLHSHRFYANVLPVRLRKQKKKLLELLPTKGRFSPLFLREYFYFSHSCRLRKMEVREVFSDEERKKLFAKIRGSVDQLNDELKYAAECCIDNHKYMRIVRSSMAFLEEDLIEGKEEMRLPWRVLRNSGGFSALNEKLIRFNNEIPMREWSVDPESHNTPFDLRTTGFSNNWWDFGEWTHRESEKTFGFKVFRRKRDEIPLLPQLNHEGPIFGQKRTQIFSEYFQFSSHCRFVNKHPLGMFGVRFFPEEKFLLDLQHMNEMLLTVCNQEEEKDLRVVRSTIEMLKEDIVPRMESALPLWEMFLEGEGFHQLNQKLKSENSCLDQPHNLRYISIEKHPWWSQEARALSEKRFGRHSGRIVSFSTFFDVPRERMLCFLENSADILKKQRTAEEFRKSARFFLIFYFQYSMRCRRHRQDPWDILTSEGRDEFQRCFPSIVPHLHWALENAEEIGLLELRQIRSSVDLLEEEMIPKMDSIREKWEEFRKNETIKDVEKRLEQQMEVKTRILDVQELPRSHHRWWPENSREIWEGMKWDWR